MTKSKTNQDPNNNYITWKSWQESSFGSFTALDRSYFAKEFESAQINITDQSHVLEIGFGNGSFAGWIAQYTENYIGIEANDELIARAHLAGFAAQKASPEIFSKLADQQFDLIAIFDVLEHLDKEQIIETLKFCRQLLNKSGKIIIRIPNGDSPFSGPIFNGDITHKNILGSKAIHQIAIMTGLDVINIKNAAFPIFGMGIKTALRRAMITLLRHTAEITINATFNGNERLPIAPNLVAILKILA